MNGRPVVERSAVHEFLAAAGVVEYVDKFVEQRVDLDALFMLNDQDLVSLGLPLGPRRKLLKAVQERAAEREADNESKLRG